MKPYSVTLIGMGPRGLSVLERIAAFARSNAFPLHLNLIEPGPCGPGANGTRLPQHLMSNSLGGQVTIFPSVGAVELPPAFATPTLAEWARAEGYRRFGEQLVQAVAGGDEVRDDQCLPRYLLGRYLAWAYAVVARALPSTVTLSHLRHRAIDMSQQPDGSFVVELDSGFSVGSDFVFLATGHGRSNLTDEESWCRKFAQDHARYNSKLAYLRHVHPFEQLGRIASDAQVGIEGLGLSAHDVVAELTVGRGGVFSPSGAGLRYQRSGQEPALMLFARHCMPALARPAPLAGKSGRAMRIALRFFTREAVRCQREQAMRERGSIQLDFDRELLPLLTREMAYAWRCAQDGPAPDPFAYQPGAGELHAVEALLYPLRGRTFDNAAEFRTFFTCLLADDLGEARRGRLTSPAKAVAEVLAEARVLLQEIVEHGGLTANSHRKFLSAVHPAISRLAFGPPAIRNEQWLALIEAGVLRVASGSNPAIRIDEERSQFVLHTRLASSSAVDYLDAIVIARQDVFSPETDDSDLMRNLLKRGTVRPYYNGAYHPGGIDIDAASHPVSRSGRVFPNLWALGCLAEGPQYVTHVLPRPGSHARPVHDADRCVRELFSTIAERESAGVTPTL